MKTLLAATLFLTAAAFAQQPMPVIPPTGHVRTPDVDLAYWVYGAPNPTATPIFAVNGGPGLSHSYMVQNDSGSVSQPIARSSSTTSAATGPRNSSTLPRLNPWTPR